MKLVFLYIEDRYGVFKGDSFSFDSNYVVVFDKPKGEIEVSKKSVLPADFFSTKEDNDDAPEDLNVWVSAIVGKNRSGKTSLCRTLFEIAEETDRIKQAMEFPWEEEPIPRIKYLMVVEERGNLRLYQNMPGHLKGNAEKSKTEYLGFDTSIGDLIYYSPYYHADHYLPVDEEGCLLDISTSRLLFEKTGDEQDNTFVQLEAQDLYQFRETERVFEFLAAWKESLGEYRNEFELPLPENLLICAERGAMSRLEKFVNDNRDRDSRYADLANIMTVDDAFTNALIAFVSDAANWHCYSETLYNQPVPPQVSPLEDSLLDIFVELGKALHFHPDTPMDVQVKGEPMFAAIEKTLVRLSELKIGNQINDRGSFTDGLNMFRILLSDMRRFPDKQNDYVITLPTSDDQILKDMGKVLKLQVKARGSWKTDYIHFGYEHITSSGEQTLLSMYSRLYHYIHKKIYETGVERGNVFLFLDESETTLHPEWQRNLVKMTIAFLEIFFPSKKFHIFFSTHSPMLISDIPKGNIVFLEENGGERNSINPVGLLNTFGANIFDLYRIPFFMEQGTVGAFAANKIQALLDKCKAWSKGDELPDKGYLFTFEERKLIDLIGDPMLIRYFRFMQAEMKVNKGNGR